MSNRYTKLGSIVYEMFGKKCSELTSQELKIYNATIYKRYKEKFPEKIKEANRRGARKWYKKHPELAHLRTRKWQKEHKEQENENKRNYYKRRTKRQKELKRLKDNHRIALKRKAEGKFTLQEWEDKKKKFDYKCIICGISEEELLNKTGIGLTIDHIIPLSKGGTNYISNIQPLCKSCNSSKRDKSAVK